MNVDIPLWWIRNGFGWFYTVLYDQAEEFVKRLAEEKKATVFSFDSKNGILVEKIEDFHYVDEETGEPLRALRSSVPFLGLLPEVDSLEHFYVSSWWGNGNLMHEDVFGNYSVAKRFATENNGMGVILSLLGEGEYRGAYDFKFKDNGKPRISEERRLEAYGKSLPDTKSRRQSGNFAMALIKRLNL